MNDTKYIGMDVHRESISIAALNSAGKIVLECVVETKASIILQFIDGLRGELHVTFEEGTWAAWLYDLLKPHVRELVVCDPRKNASMKQGNKSDKIDARQLAELLRLDHLNPVYHGEHGLRSLKELVRSYLTITKDVGRVMSRVKAIYRSWGIACSGKQVYAPQHRVEWLAKITEPGVRRRAEFYYQQLDALRSLRFGGLGIETYSSADHRYVEGQLKRSKKPALIRGLNENCNHDVKNLLKGAAIIASTKPGPFQEFYTALLAKGMRPEMARLTLARKIATIVLIVWKRGVSFDAQHLKPQTA